MSSQHKDPSRVNPERASDDDPVYCWFPASRIERNDSVVIYDRTAKREHWIVSDTHERVKR